MCEFEPEFMAHNLWAINHGMYEVKLASLCFREIFDRQTGRSFSGTASSSSIFSSEASSTAFLIVSAIRSAVDSVTDDTFDTAIDEVFDDVFEGARDTTTDDTFDDACDNAFDEVLDDAFETFTDEFCVFGDSSVGISDSIICDSWSADSATAFIKVRLNKDPGFVASRDSSSCLS